MEGLHLYLKVVQVFKTENVKILYYYIFGWGKQLFYSIRYYHGENCAETYIKGHCLIDFPLDNSYSESKPARHQDIP